MFWLAAAAAGLSLSTPPRTFFASCVKGLEPVLATELRAARVGALDVQEGRLGVSFSGGDLTGVRATLWARSAIRVMQLLDAADDVFTADELYEVVRAAADWPGLVGKQQTLSVSAVLGSSRAQESGRMRPGDWECTECGELVFASKTECFKCGAPKPPDDGRSLTHSHFTALTVKNAIVDACRDARGSRPSVDTQDADVPLFLHLHRGRASLYRILSGGASMHKRGYRTGVVHAAALKETMAAGLLLLAGYDPRTHVLCDPMAGSGTIAIEAALIATNTAPGLLRPPPAVARWADIDGGALWAEAAAEADALRTADAPRGIYASDAHGGALELARRGADAAGVSGCITFDHAAAADFSPAERPSLVITNPPWDRRLDGGEQVWMQLGGFLKRECAGSSAWVLSGNRELTQHLRMKSASRHRIEHAGTSLAYISYAVQRAADRAQPGDWDCAQCGAHVFASKAACYKCGAPKPAAAAAAGEGEGEGTPSGERRAPSPEQAAAAFAEAEARAAARAAEEAEEYEFEFEVVEAAEAVDAAALEALTVPSLKERCRSLGLRVGGRKAELVARLLEAAAPDGVDEADGAAAAAAGSGAASVLVDATGADGDGLESIFAGMYGAAAEE